MNAEHSAFRVLTRILADVGAIVWEGDPQTYAFTYVSAGAERLLGYPALRWIEDPAFWVDHIHPDDREWVLTFCRDCTSRLEEHEFDYRMIAADGRVVWLRDVVRVEGRDGRPVRSVGVMTDVTSLKEAEVRAAQAEAQWRSLVDGMPDIIALLDERGRVEFVNHLPACVESVEQLNRLGPTAWLDAASRAAWRRAFTEVVTTGERREFEVCVPKPGESPQWFMTRFTRVALAGFGPRRVGRYLSISTDVTAQKRLEAQLRQQLRLESLGTLASGVAHEINNPIQGILNYAELIGGRATEPETVSDFAEEIIHESKRVANIVRRLLAFSRQDADQRFEPCEVRALIDASLALIHAILRKDQITVEVDVPDGLPQICCRIQQIQQIIMNLVTNARDALNARAMPDERTDRDEAARRITISARALTRAARSWVRISVADQANGIPEAIRARIFDPFFTTKGRDQGTGLGLSVSHGIAAEHGGELSFESEVGIGSTFHLDLPVAGSPTAR